MSLKIAIFTAVYGGKDKLKEPFKFKKNENIDYFLITDDRVIESKFYQVIYKEPFVDDITKNARYYKIIGLDLFNEYDYVIWHDANIQMNHDEIPNLLSFASKNSFAFYCHPVRNCIYDEAIKCIKLEKDYPYKLLKQVLKYFLKGVKNNDGLFATGLYVRNNQFINVDFINQWWIETKNYSRRDQISLSYCLKKFKIYPAIINGDIRHNKYSSFHRHKHFKYEFLRARREIFFFEKQKKIAIKIILFLKKINFSGV
ncbi:glycosyltransferase domain-containing protein [uncultured Algibacter sp.]|uniref:glycosyltransferase domain-containing protein n=1 Tax=uncultured Algibacter sp. TaxID=298659 RepID=UPI00260411DA|nr:glycosyltransferase domain-containing protein [uncultured Algibacter sp.]